MRNRRRHTPDAVERLRLAIDCMPVATREAMLAGVRGAERVIAGAYVDDRGGVCPMLAAHRRGARTDFISFARAWDRFTRAGRTSRTSRPATERELAILVTHLQASLLDANGPELDEAIRDHRALRKRRLLTPARGTRGEESQPSGRRSKLSEAADPSGEMCLRRLRLARTRLRPAAAVGAVAQTSAPGVSNG